MVSSAPALAASKGHLLAIADGVSQCADGGLAARSSLQALALDYYADSETWAIVQSLDRLLLAQNRWLQANGGGQPLLTTLTALRAARHPLHPGPRRRLPGLPVARRRVAPADQRPRLGTAAYVRADPRPGTGPASGGRLSGRRSGARQPVATGQRRRLGDAGRQRHPQHPAQRRRAAAQRRGSGSRRPPGRQPGQRQRPAGARGSRARRQPRRRPRATGRLAICRHR